MIYAMRTSSACLMLMAMVPLGVAAASTVEEGDDSPRELSVAPLDHVVYPDTRPDWITETADEDSNRIVIISGPCDTEEESLAEIQLMKRAAAAALVARIAESDGRFDFFPLDDERIEKDYVKESYEGTVKQGDQTCYEHAVEISFSKSQREEVKEAWRNIEVRDRLSAMGVVSFSGLAMLLCGSAVTGMLSRRATRKDQAKAKAEA